MTASDKTLDDSGNFYLGRWIFFVKNFSRFSSFSWKNFQKIDRKFFFRQKSSKTVQLQNDSDKPYLAPRSCKMAHSKGFCLQLNLKIEKMQVHVFEPIKTCSISTYTNTSWYRPFSHQKHYINDKRVDSGGHELRESHFPCSN